MRATQGAVGGKARLHAWKWVSLPKELCLTFYVRANRANGIEATRHTRRWVRKFLLMTMKAAEEIICIKKSLNRCCYLMYHQSQSVHAVAITTQAYLILRTLPTFWCIGGWYGEWLLERGFVKGSVPNITRDYWIMIHRSFIREKLLILCTPTINAS